MDQRQQQAYLYRGLCYVELGKAEEAVFDLERSSSDDFSPNLALMRAYMLQEHFGDAYLQGERVLSLAETNQEKALAYYWRALNFEERDEPDNAAESWQELLSLPRSSMSSEMRAEAQEHFLDIYTLTPTTTPTNTYTPLPSFTPSRTPTPTRTPTASRTPTPSRTPTETLTPTFTRTPTSSN
jgi:tetratricopeptide (TPR) repeat protein